LILLQAVPVPVPHPAPVPASATIPAPATDPIPATDHVPVPLLLLLILSLLLTFCCCPLSPEHCTGPSGTQLHSILHPSVATSSECQEAIHLVRKAESPAKDDKWRQTASNGGKRRRIAELGGKKR
jgi:hypothetical protein